MFWICFGYVCSPSSLPLQAVTFKATRSHEKHFEKTNKKNPQSHTATLTLKKASTDNFSVAQHFKSKDK